MVNYESPTTEQAGESGVQGLYYETNVWHTNNWTVETKALVFAFAALAVYALEVAVLLLSEPPKEG